MVLREQLEERERRMLSPFAMCAADSKGRMEPEEPCSTRTDYQRDRDRIIHSKSFRRRMHKTQVFLAPEGDHFRTRLTHTLEVAQIARTVARVLALNEDLTEAIALGHDLGHSPFGHAGEAALDQICPHGYRHYMESVRVVHYIEKNGKGLNLTQQVKNGIACHTNRIANTREGNIVRVADRIAYINHDIDDAIRGGILSKQDLPRDCVAVLGDSKSSRITTMISSVIANGPDIIRMTKDIQQAHDVLHRFLSDHVYSNSAAKTEEPKAQALVIRLYTHFIKHINDLPIEYRMIAERFDIDRAVCDYIAGMSDDFAIRTYERLFVPRCWDVR